MTTEQAIKWLKNLYKGLAMPQYEDALEMAIQALQAQADCNTCDKAVRDRVGVIGCAKFDSKPTVAIPSAEPTGHWLDMGSGQECSKCGEVQHGYDNFRYFCPNCGEKMVEPQERSEE